MIQFLFKLCNFVIHVYTFYPKIIIILGDVKWETNNRMNIGELWVNLFKFYAVTLKHEHIVCIQQLEPLTVTSKKWSFQKGIPIEGIILFLFNVPYNHIVP